MAKAQKVKPKKKTSPQKVKSPKEYLENGRTMQEVESLMNKAALDVFTRYMAEHPEVKGAGFFPLITNRCYKNGAVPFSDVYLKIIDYLLLHDGLNKSQKDILAEINKSFPQGKISPNIWTKPLNKTHLKKIGVRIRGNMREPVSVDGCKTLSDIKRTLFINRPAKDATLQYSGKISFNRDTLNAGKAVYPLTWRNDNYYIQVPIPSTGKRQWIRMDALVALLSNLRVTRID